MFKQIVILIDRLEQCVSVLQKLYRILLKLSELTERSVERYFADHSTTSTPVTALYRQAVNGEQVPCYDEDELMTVKEAMAELNVSRWKISEMRTNGELTDIARAGRVRLIRAEVMAAKLWYSRMKGKI